MKTLTTLRFPSFTAKTADEFRRQRRERGAELDERYRREQALGSQEDIVRLEGTCGLCKRVTYFVSQTTSGTITDDGRKIPNWREQQACECSQALICRRRGLLHLAQFYMAEPSWFRLGLLGADDACAAFLLTQYPDLTSWPRLRPPSGLLSAHIPAVDGAFHLVLSADHLQCVPPIDAAFSEVARVLSVGGVFLFSVPFNVSQETTQSKIFPSPQLGDGTPTVLAEAVHDFGWDIIDRVRGAGFEDCRAHCYWSEEFGYLGTFNVVFEAFR